MSAERADVEALQEALSSLIDVVVPGLDSGDIVADAGKAIEAATHSPLYPAIDWWGAELPGVRELHREVHPDDGVFDGWLEKQPRGHYSTSTTDAARSMRMGYELGRVVERRTQGNALARTQMLETVNREECRQLRAEVIERRAKDAAVAELTEAAVVISVNRDIATSGQWERFDHALAAVRGGAQS